jgi:hypothetical protein
MLKKANVDGVNESTLAFLLNLHFRSNYIMLRMENGC